MELKKILAGIENIKTRGDETLDIKSIENNSKNVKDGSLFIAIIGYEDDGHNYVNEAIENGAVAVMLDAKADFSKIKMKPGITVIIAQDTR